MSDDYWATRDDSKIPSAKSESIIVSLSLMHGNFSSSDRVIKKKEKEKKGNLFFIESRETTQILSGMECVRGSTNVHSTEPPHTSKAHGCMSILRRSRNRFQLLHFTCRAKWGGPSPTKEKSHFHPLLCWHCFFPDVSLSVFSKPSF